MSDLRDSYQRGEKMRRKPFLWSRYTERELSISYVFVPPEEEKKRRNKKYSKANRRKPYWWKGKVFCVNRKVPPFTRGKVFREKMGCWGVKEPRTKGLGRLLALAVELVAVVRAGWEKRWGRSWKELMGKWVEVRKQRRVWTKLFKEVSLLN